MKEQQELAALLLLLAILKAKADCATSVSQRVQERGVRFGRHAPTLRAFSERNPAIIAISWTDLLGIHKPQT